MKKCSKCNIMKDYKDFYNPNKSNTCKTCHLIITREYKKNKRLDTDFKKLESKKQKERRYRLWQNTLINDSKRGGKNNNLTIDDINEMYEKQNGLCYWFKIPLIPSPNKKSPQQPSLDRLDRSKGYTKENVVLSCYSANIGRNENDLETWTNFLKLLNL